MSYQPTKEDCAKDASGLANPNPRLVCGRGASWPVRHENGGRGRSAAPPANIRQAKGAFTGPCRLRHRRHTAGRARATGVEGGQPCRGDPGAGVPDPRPPQGRVHPRRDRRPARCDQVSHLLLARPGRTLPEPASASRADGTPTEPDPQSVRGWRIHDPDHAQVRGVVRPGPLRRKGGILTVPVTINTMRQSTLGTADTCLHRLQYLFDPNVPRKGSVIRTIGTGYHAGIAEYYFRRRQG